MNEMNDTQFRNFLHSMRSMQNLLFYISAYKDSAMSPKNLANYTSIVMSEMEKHHQRAHWMNLMRIKLGAKS
jgi:hypothetical protein